MFIEDERACLTVTKGFNVSKVGNILSTYKFGKKVKKEVIYSCPDGTLKRYRVDMKGSDGFKVVVMYKLSTCKGTELVNVHDIQISYDGDNHIMYLGQARDCMPCAVLVTVDDIFNRSVNYHMLLTTEFIL